MKIFLWIVGIYVVSIPVSQILAYLAGLINRYLCILFFDEQFWFDKGTIINDIHEDIVNGENYGSFRETRYIPLANIFFSVTWFIGELVLFCLLVVFLVIKFLVELMMGLSGIIILTGSSISEYIGKLSGPKKLKESISKPFREAKEKILNLRIS